MTNHHDEKQTISVDFGVTHKINLNIVTGEIHIQPRSLLKRSFIYRILEAFEHIFSPSSSTLGQDINIFVTDYSNFRHCFRMSETITHIHQKKQAETAAHITKRTQ